MKRVAKFQKVSFEQFLADMQDFKFDINKVQTLYDDIALPKRATKGSAGYDFFMPLSLTLKPGESVRIPTGIRSYIEDGWVLKCYPRSGLGFKYRLQFDNTVGIIDSDYYNSSNEGHIQAKLTNGTLENKTLVLEQGQGFMQGVFVEYGITLDDECEGIRDGGFGSTTQR